MFVLNEPLLTNVRFNFFRFQVRIAGVGHFEGKKLLFFVFVLNETLLTNVCFISLGFYRNCRYGAFQTSKNILNETFINTFVFSSFVGSKVLFWVFSKVSNWVFLFLFCRFRCGLLDFEGIYLENFIFYSFFKRIFY